MRRAIVGVLLGLALPKIALAQGADRVPVAVVWLGEPQTLEAGARVAGELNAQLGKTPGVRPLDSADDRRALVEGGTVTRAAQLQAQAEQAFGRLKLADAARLYEQVEQLLLTDVPIPVTQERLGAVERSLLVIYDQLGRAEDAARAAERLGWTAGTNEDVKALLDKHGRSRAWQPAYAPVQVQSQPPGALVYRNLQPEGAAPVAVPGGDPALDVLDAEAPGYRRAHVELGHGAPEVTIPLVKEDRLGALVDELRTQPTAPPASRAVALGRRVGAERVLALLPDGPDKLVARWLEVGSGKWTKASLRTDASGQVAMERLAGFVSPGATVPSPKAAAQAVVPPPEVKKSKFGAWGKWYTWVAAGGLLLVIGGLLIADNVGSDKLTISASH